MKMLKAKKFKEIKHKKDVWFKELQSRIRSEVSESQAKIIDLASEKGASSWLTSLPLAKYGFVLNKQMFHDASKQIFFFQVNKFYSLSFSCIGNKYTQIIQTD